MNIEVKRSIEIEDVLGGLKNTMEYGSKEINREMLEDTIHVIEVLVKKNKQLRDINKNLSDKIAKKYKTISELEMKVKENNCCCKGEQEKQKPKEYDLQDVLNEIVVIGKLIGIL